MHAFVKSTGNFLIRYEWLAASVQPFGKLAAHRTPLIFNSKMKYLQIVIITKRTYHWKHKIKLYSYSSSIAFMNDKLDIFLHSAQGIIRVFTRKVARLAKGLIETSQTHNNQLFRNTTRKTSWIFLPDAVCWDESGLSLVTDASSFSTDFRVFLSNCPRFMRTSSSKLSKQNSTSLSCACIASMYGEVSARWRLQ